MFSYGIASLRLPTTSHHPSPFFVRRLVGPNSSSSFFVVAIRLLSQGDYDKRTPLMLAAAEGHVHVARYLLKVGAAPCGQDKFGGTALEDAVRAKDLTMVTLLVAHGVALNLDSSSMNPACEMCFAAAGGDIEKVRILLDAKVPPDIKDYDDRTPMHLAACEGHLSIIKLLLKRGSQHSPRDR